LIWPIFSKQDRDSTKVDCSRKRRHSVCSASQSVSLLSVFVGYVCSCRVLESDCRPVWPVSMKVDDVREALERITRYIQRSECWVDPTVLVHC